MDWGARITLLLMFLNVAILGQSNEATTESSSTVGDHEPLATAVNDLGLKLTMELMKHDANNVNNIVLSPTGIAGLLAMTLLGSAGRTYDELATTLGFSQDIITNRENHERLGELLSLLTTNSSRTLYADAIFVDAHTHVREVYQQYLRRVYRGDALVTSFSNTEQAKNNINEWVKNHTNGIIEEFLKQPLPLQTKAVLLTALYFQGQWERPFLPSHTAKSVFKSPAGDVMADLMLNMGPFKYIFSVEDDLHMVALPYNDSTTTMYVLKPMVPKRLSLPKLMARLNYSRIDHLIARMSDRKAVIRFPKLEIKSSTALEDSLKALGLHAMFSPQDANFALMIDVHKEENSTEEELLSRISSEDRTKEVKDAVNRLPNPKVHVDTVLHDVKISINEFGTEAVAATSGLLARSAEQFYANSPFYMFIRNENTKLVTFSAVIFNPTV